MGDAKPEYEFEDKCQLLECDCREPSCWPWLVKITAAQDEVVWSDFENWHRDWSYAGFGPFVFRRADYESALRVLLKGD